MNKQKSSGGQSKQSAGESASRGGEQGVRTDKSANRGKEATSAPKSGGKGGGAKQQRKH